MKRFHVSMYLCIYWVAKCWLIWSPHSLVATFTCCISFKQHLFLRPRKRQYTSPLGCCQSLMDFTSENNRNSDTFEKKTQKKKKMLFTGCWPWTFREWCMCCRSLHQYNPMMYRCPERDMQVFLDKFSTASISFVLTISPKKKRKCCLHLHLVWRTLNIVFKSMALDW